MDEKQRQNLVHELENEIWEIFSEMREPNSILWNHITFWLDMDEDDIEQIKLEGFEELTNEKIAKLKEFVTILDNVVLFTEEEIYRIQDKYEEYLNNNF